MLTETPGAAAKKFLDEPYNVITSRKSMPDADSADWVKPSEMADVPEFICSEKGSVLREPVYKVYNNA